MHSLFFLLHPMLLVIEKEGRLEWVSALLAVLCMAEEALPLRLLLGGFLDVVSCTVSHAVL
jgi:hypothetical protein